MGGGGEAEDVATEDGAPPAEPAEPEPYTVGLTLSLELELGPRAVGGKVCTPAAGAAAEGGEGGAQAAEGGAEGGAPAESQAEAAGASAGGQDGAEGAEGAGADASDAPPWPQTLRVTVRHTLWGEAGETAFQPVELDASGAQHATARHRVACAQEDATDEGDGAGVAASHVWEPADAAVRALAEAAGRHAVTVEVCADGGEPAVAQVELDCAGLLVGDRVASRTLPAATAVALGPAVCGGVVRLELSRPLLSPELAETLNPLVVRPQALSDLPDLPGAREALDTACEAPHVVFALPGLEAPAKAPATAVGAWRMVDAEMRLSVRTATFEGAAPTVVLAGELDQAELYARCLRGAPFEVLVYDRTERAPAGEEGAAAEASAAAGEGGEAAAGAEAAGGGGGEPGSGAGAAPAAAAGVMGRAEPGHGAVKVSLAPFCNGARAIDLDAPVVAIHKMLTNGQDPSWSTRPGLYMQAGAELRMSLRLATPLVRPHADRPFVRLVASMAYEDTELMNAVLSVARACNARALGLSGSPGHVLKTLVTYQFTEEQQNDHALDVVTGFQLIDGATRAVVVEGLPGGSLRELLAAARALCTPAARATWPRRRLLVNDRLAYSARLYGGLGADVRPLKLRAKLAQIVASPATFAVGKVKEDCMAAVKRLHALSQSRWMRQVEHMKLLPTEAMLSAIDKKFGGGLTLADLEGVEAEAQASAAKMDADADEDTSRQDEAAEAAGDELGEEPDLGQTVATITSTTMLATTKRSTLRKGHTMHTNEAYEAYRAVAATRSFDAHDRNLTVMRECERTQGVALRESHAHWLAKGIWENARKDETVGEGSSSAGGAGGEDAVGRGHRNPFKWPAAKTSEEFMHNMCPNKPSAARSEELAHEWVENELHNVTISRGGRTIEYKDDFKLRVPKINLFEQDPEKFKSVHLTGDGLAEEQRLAKEAEDTEWNRKVVVDTLYMNTAMPNKPEIVVEGVDKKSTILHDPPNRHGLTMRPSRTMVISTTVGATMAKRRPMVDQSVEGARSLFLGPHETAVDIAGTFRQTQPQKWLAGRDFDATKLPASMRTSVGTRDIPTLRDEERKGERYTKASVHNAPFVPSESLALYGRVTKDSPLSMRKQATYVPPEGLTMYGRPKEDQRSGPASHQ